MLRAKGNTQQYNTQHCNTQQYNTQQYNTFLLLYFVFIYTFKWFERSHLFTGVSHENSSNSSSNNKRFRHRFKCLRRFNGNC